MADRFQVMANKPKPQHFVGGTSTTRPSEPPSASSPAIAEEVHNSSNEEFAPPLKRKRRQDLDELPPKKVAKTGAGSKGKSSQLALPYDDFGDLDNSPDENQLLDDPFTIQSRKKSWGDTLSLKELFARSVDFADMGHKLTKAFRRRALGLVREVGALKDAQSELEEKIQTIASLEESKRATVVKEATDLREKIDTLSAQLVSLKSSQKAQLAAERQKGREEGKELFLRSEEFSKLKKEHVAAFRSSPELGELFLNALWEVKRSGYTEAVQNIKKDHCDLDLNLYSEHNFYNENAEEAYSQMIEEFGIVLPEDEGGEEEAGDRQSES